jgi:hypothetical protein
MVGHVMNTRTQCGKSLSALTDSDYHAHDGADTVRLTEPHRLVSSGHRWYLLAWDIDKRDWRTFRVGQGACLVDAGSDTPHMLALYLGLLDADFRVDESAPPELAGCLRALSARYARAVG